MDLVRYLNLCMWWNGRRVWVSTPLQRLAGEIVRVTAAQTSDVDLTVLLEGGAVVKVRGGEKGRLWDFV
jgi:hypothetical protein